ncbi:MAG TPA: hypothetical protein VNO21_23125, partial [Polyangiaceae bacterium]|nr:hypothetical protein [Polyangiaceae bacterium]
MTFLSTRKTKKTSKNEQTKEEGRRITPPSRSRIGITRRRSKMGFHERTCDYVVREQVYRLGYFFVTIEVCGLRPWRRFSADRVA